MSSIIKMLIKASGNRLMQRMLERNVLTSQYLMGIGTGSGVHSSGEQEIFHVLKEITKPPYCIFDVGSNKGQFLGLLLHHISGDQLKVHCFEPGQETFKLLSKSTDGDSRVILNNIGLGKAKSIELLHYDNKGSGLASLTKRRLDHFNIDFGNSEEVVIDTIDNYCSLNAIDRIHLLKLDIEGHELDALAGAREMFSRRSIDMVTFEFGGCNIDTRTFFQDFWYFFNEFGFSLFRITPSGYMHPISAYQEIDEQFRASNFMAIAKQSINS